MIKKYCRLIIFIAFVAAVVLYVPEVWHIFKLLLRALKPVFIAIFLALVFNIPINFLFNKVLKLIKKEKARYFLSLIIVYVSVFGLFGVGLYFLIPEVIESVKGFIEKLPNYGDELKTALTNSLNGFGIDEAKINEMIDSIKNRLLSSGEGINDVIDDIKNTFTGTLDLFFAVIMSIYILLDKKRLIRQFKQFINAIMPHKSSKSLQDATKVTSVIFAKFLGGQFIEAMLLGIFTLLGMLVLKLPYAPIVSVIVFVSNLIPMIGAYIGGAIGFVLIALVSVKQAVIFIIFTVILQQIENNVTYPKVVGNSLGLSAFWIMASVLVGGSLFGFWGIMLGVPAVGALYKLIGHKLSKNGEAGALIPDILKEPAKPRGNDCPEERSDKGDGNSGP